MKYIIIVVILIVLAGLSFVLWRPDNTDTFVPVDERVETGQDTEATEGVEQANRSVVSDGGYNVVVEESSVEWAGQKPFIDGYVNTGTLGIGEGSIMVEGNQATGSFTIDMNTLRVSETQAKPGSESLLEGHLKGERWFDVATYPTATFAISSVTPREDSDTTYIYDVFGSLTMKGETEDISFPARIFADEGGVLVAEASLEIDRTRWGITAGSGSFFDGLADNVVDDMIALSFVVRATQ
jgi:polyisoprenoid-binding protein YceI